MIPRRSTRIMAAVLLLQIGPLSALPEAKAHVSTYRDSKRIIDAMDVYLEYELNQTEGNLLGTEETLREGIAQEASTLTPAIYRGVLERLAAEYMQAPMHRPRLEGLFQSLSMRMAQQHAQKRKDAPLSMLEAACALAVLVGALHYGPRALQSAQIALEPQIAWGASLTEQALAWGPLNRSLFGKLYTPKQVLMLPVNLARGLFNRAGLIVGWGAAGVEAAPTASYSLAVLLGASGTAWAQLYDGSRPEPLAVLALAQAKSLDDLEAALKSADSPENASALLEQVGHLAQVGRGELKARADAFIKAAPPSSTDALP